MEALGNMSPMPDDVGEEQVEKMRETCLTDFMHVSPHFFHLGRYLTVSQWRGRRVIIISC